MQEPRSKVLCFQKTYPLWQRILGAFFATVCSVCDGSDVSGLSHCTPQSPELSKANAQALFDYSTIPTFDIYLPPEEWERLKINARDEEYVKADACFEDQHIGKVGIRFKGSVGTLHSCFDDNGNLTCKKLSIKLKFSEYNRENRFFGLKRLNFQGYQSDATYMKEKLAYDLYRQMDIVAPRAAWAQIRVNGVHQGLFGMVEQIDGRFTADRFPKSPDGNLYKELWPGFTDETWIRRRLKTNEDAPDLSGFVGFSKAIVEAEETKLRETLGRFMDLDYLARYMAVDDAIFNVDGITAYYDSVKISERVNHNYYIYEESLDHYTLIPWDQDQTFTVRAGFGAVPHWLKVTEDCNRRYPVWNSTQHVTPPGCDAVFKAIKADIDVYRKSCEFLLAGPFTEEAMGSVIDDHAAFIREAVSLDTNGSGILAFNRTVSDLKRRDIPLLRERLTYLHTSKSWGTFLLHVDAINDFETQDRLGVWMGGEVNYNFGSTVDLTLNTNNPIKGKKSLRISFDYGNDSKEWGQWMNYLVPFKNGNQDVTGLKGIRMWVRADQERTLRLNLSSINASKNSSGIAFGWDIPVTTHAKEVELRFKDAAIVSWAEDPGDKLQDILKSLGGLIFFPQCKGRSSDGFLPDGTRDIGFIEVDNISFFLSTAEAFFSRPRFNLFFKGHSAVIRSVTIFSKYLSRW